MATKSSTAATAPKVGEMVHYVPAVQPNHGRAGECTPAHVLGVAKNQVVDGEVVGYDVERLTTARIAVVDARDLQPTGVESSKTMGREYSKDRHLGTWHYPADCGN